MDNNGEAPSVPPPAAPPPPPPPLPPAIPQTGQVQAPTFNPIARGKRKRQAAAETSAGSFSPNSAAGGSSVADSPLGVAGADVGVGTGAAGGGPVIDGSSVEEAASHGRPAKAPRRAAGGGRGGGSSGGSAGSGGDGRGGGEGGGGDGQATVTAAAATVTTAVPAATMAFPAVTAAAPAVTTFVPRSLAQEGVTAAFAARPAGAGAGPRVGRGEQVENYAGREREQPGERTADHRERPRKAPRRGEKAAGGRGGGGAGEEGGAGGGGAGGAGSGAGGGKSKQTRRVLAHAHKNREKSIHRWIDHSPSRKAAEARARGGSTRSNRAGVHRGLHRPVVLRSSRESNRHKKRRILFGDATRQDTAHVFLTAHARYTERPGVVSFLHLARYIMLRSSAQPSNIAQRSPLSPEPRFIVFLRLVGVILSLGPLTL